MNEAAKAPSILFYDDIDATRTHCLAVVFAAQTLIVQAIDLLLICHGKDRLVSLDLQNIPAV